LLNIVSAGSLDEVEARWEAWDKLVVARPGSVPALSSAYVIPFFENQLEPGEEWRCLFVYDEDRLVGVLPLVLTKGRIMGLKTMYLATPENNHIYSVDLVASADCEKDVFLQILAYLDRIEPKRQHFRMNHLPEASTALTLLSGSIPGASVVKEFDGYGSYLRIEGSFEDYRAGLSANFRHNLRKSSNKISRLGDVKTVFMTGAEAGEREFQSFLKVEASGWKGRRGSAIMVVPELRAFYSNVVRRLAELGWLEWHFLVRERKAIAGQLAVKIGRKLTIVKIGYDEEYSRYSPGNYLFERTVERAYASGDTDEIDCLTDMTWHRNWNMEQRAYYSLRIYPRRLIPLILGAAARKSRNGLRHVPGVMPLYHGLRRVIDGGRHK
jgi:CelD/BcsL family acetyltransferase involved in cellulose biosynthesis